MASKQPTSGLVVDGMPRTKIVGHQPPGGPSPNDQTEGVEDFAERELSSRGGLVHECRVGGDELPFLVANIAVIGFSRSVHAQRYELNSFAIPDLRALLGGDRPL